MKQRLLVALLSLMLFAPFLGAVRLFDWDEINFAEAAREMIETGDYLHVHIDYVPFYEKPPLFIWAQVLSMKTFGVNEFAARFPNAIIGMITLVVIFTIGSRLYGDRFGWLWVIVYAGSLLPHFYFRSGIIDPMFNLLIFLSALWMLKGMQGAGVRNAAIAGVFAAAAVMTKGPVGYGLVMLTTAFGWLVLRRSFRLPWKQVLVASVVTVVLSSIWFLVDYLQNGPTFVQENIAYQIRLLTTGDAGHEQPFWYHPVVVFIGCFPASMLLFGGLRPSHDERPDQRAMRLWMIVLMVVVLVVFSIVKTKIIHYSSMTYLPLTFLAAVYLERWISGVRRWPWWNTTLTVGFAAVWSGLAFIALWAFMDRDWLLSLPTFRDPFLKEAIMRDVSWIGIEPYVGILVVAGAVLAWMLRHQGAKVASVVALFGGTLLFVEAALPLVAPSIEPYTQGAALDFYERQVGRDVYVKPLSMKSYAHLFYTRKPQHLSAAFMGIDHDAWEPWLLEGPIVKPAYFVSRIQHAGRWRDHPNLTEIGAEGGFVFFQRLPESAGAGSATP